MFNIPDNPYSQHPERKSTVRTRVAAFLGGVATAAASAEIYIHTSAYDLARSYISLTIPVSVIAMTMPVIAEFQERFRTDGGGGGGWYVPDFPETPTPSGPSVPVPKERTLVSV